MFKKIALKEMTWFEKITGWITLLGMIAFSLGLFLALAVATYEIVFPPVVDTSVTNLALYSEAFIPGWRAKMCFAGLGVMAMGLGLHGIASVISGRLKGRTQA